MGRAARNVKGRVILYADIVTKSIEDAVNETKRRREIQAAFNEKHGIIPQSARKPMQAPLIEEGAELEELSEKLAGYELIVPAEPEEQEKLVKKLKAEMLEAASKKEFERAAELRDMLKSLEELIIKA